MKITYLIAGSFVFGGCASTSPAPALRDTSALVQSRAGYSTTWLKDDEAEDAARIQVRDLLKEDLTLDSAIRVSLLSNRSLQAMFEDVGVAQADLVQAGLLKNPTFSGNYRFSLDSSSGAGVELNLMTDLMLLLTLGSRKSVALAGLEGAKARTAGRVLEHIYQVQSAFLSMQAASQTLAMQQIIADAGDAAVELSRHQHDAGNISDLDLANEETLFAQVTMDLTRVRITALQAREHLNRLMGVWGTETGWKISVKLADLPNVDADVEHIESKAIAARIDLVAAHKDVEVVSYGLALAKNTRWFGGVDAGVAYTREPERYTLIGPSLTVEIPLFDQRQAAIARIEAQFRAAKARETALAVDIRSEVRELAGRIALARSVVQMYQTTLVPLRERVVALSQQQYNAMLLSVFQLLIARQNEISAYREFLSALHDYWVLRAELDWKSGGATRSKSSSSMNPSAIGSSPILSPAATQSDSSKGPPAHVHHTP